jgi:hypothetical protein
MRDGFVVWVEERRRCGTGLWFGFEERRRRGKKVARGECEAKRSTLPLDRANKRWSPEGAAYLWSHPFSVGPSGLKSFVLSDPGAARFTLAPGYLISRLRRWAHPKHLGAARIPNAFDTARIVNALNIANAFGPLARVRIVVPVERPLVTAISKVGLLNPVSETFPLA